MKNNKLEEKKDDAVDSYNLLKDKMIKFESLKQLSHNDLLKTNHAIIKFISLAGYHDDKFIRDDIGSFEDEE